MPLLEYGEFDPNALTQHADAARVLAELETARACNDIYSYTILSGAGEALWEPNTKSSHPPEPEIRSYFGLLHKSLHVARNILERRGVAFLPEHIAITEESVWTLVTDPQDTEPVTIKEVEDGLSYVLPGFIPASVKTVRTAKKVSTPLPTAPAHKVNPVVLKSVLAKRLDSAEKRDAKSGAVLLPSEDYSHFSEDRRKEREERLGKASPLQRMMAGYQHHRTVKRRQRMRVKPAPYSDDLIKMYLDEAGQVPRLTSEQEAMLSERIKVGLIEWRKVEANKPYDETLIIEAADAYNWFMSSAQLLVVGLARKVKSKTVPLIDRIQLGNGAYGNGGLPRAIEKFDPKKGFEFSTYAEWWIGKAIFRGMAQTSRTIRLPRLLHEHILEFNKKVTAFAAKKGREPTFEEMKQDMGWLTPSELEMIHQLREEPKSLDAPLPHTDSGETEYDIIPDASDHYGEKDSDLDRIAKLREALLRARNTKRQPTVKHGRVVLPQLTEREEIALILRYGFDFTEDNAALFTVGAWQRALKARTELEELKKKRIDKMTLPDVGHVFGLGSIQNTQSKALGKIIRESESPFELF